MTDSFSYKCPQCGNSITIDVAQLSVIWKTTKVKSRVYGEEIDHCGFATCICNYCNDTSVFDVHIIEYPTGTARSQSIFHLGSLISDETDLSIHAPFKQSSVNCLLYGSRFPSRDNSDYFIVDRSSDYYASRLLLNVLHFLNIPPLLGFPYDAEFKRKDLQVSNKDLLPPAVCSCMDPATKIIRNAHAKRCTYRLRKVIKDELGRLGYTIGQKSISTKNNCKNPLGNCAEVHAAHKLIKETKCSIGDIIFGVAVRPRTMQIILPCENCTTVFPTL